MSTSWSGRLQANEGHNLRLYVKIQGIANIFQEDETDVPSSIEAAARPRSKLITSIQQGETRLNLSTRRVEGGSLTIRMTDDDDGTLAALFGSVRKRRQTFIVPNVGNFESASDTTINVKSTSRLASAGVVYVGAETITYTGKTATTLTGCTRGAHSSEAQKHYGGIEDGAPVFDVPPTWIGRRVYLRGYFVDQDGTTNSSLDESLGVFRIEGQPRHLGDSEWEIQCSELSDEFATKKIGGGISDVEPTDAVRIGSVVASAGTTKTIKVGKGRAFNQFVTGSATTYVKIVGDDETTGIFRLVGQVTGASDDSIQYDFDEQLVQPPPPTWHAFVKTIRHVTILRERAWTIARRVLTSRLGDGTNGSYDDLPGRERDAMGQDQWRMGAGISSSEVNAQSLLAYAAGKNWSYIIDEETTVGEFMSEFCTFTDTAWFVDRNGRLTVASLSEDGTASVVNINDDMIVDHTRTRVEHDESSIVPRANLECNYDPITGQYLARFNLFDSEIQSLYPTREDSISVKSKTIVVDEVPLGGPLGSVSRPSISRGELETRVRRMQSHDKRGRGFVHLVCHLPVIAAEVGDVVTLTTTIPDLEGGSSLSARLCRVVSMRPRYDDAEVDVSVQLVDKLFRVAPACTVASVAGSVLNLTTSGIETGSATPGRMFQAGWDVQLWDMSAGTYTQNTIGSVTDTTITLASGAPPVGFGATPGEDMVRVDSIALNDGRSVSTNGYTPDDFIYQMSNDEYDVHSVNPSIDITRWR